MTKLAHDWYVEIVAFENAEVIKRMGPMSKARADKVEAGVMINNNHEKYYVRCVTTSTDDDSC